MNSAYIAPSTAAPSINRRARLSRRALLPLLVGGCALPAFKASAQTPPIRPSITPATSATSIAKAAASETPPVAPKAVLSSADKRAIASKIAAPAPIKIANSAAIKVSAPTENSALKPIQKTVQEPTKTAAPVNTSLRLAQLTPGDTEAPATPPETGPDGLTVPIGPDVPENGTPAAPPPDNSVTPPTQVPPIGTPNLNNAPDQPAIIGDVRAAEGREIADVRVVGSRVVPADTVLAQVRLQRGAAFSSRQAQLDLGRINQLGFFASTQAQVAPDLNDPTKVVVTYIVVENRVITGFEFVNNTAVKPADITPILTSKIGTVLNRNLVAADVSAVQKYYQDKRFRGYRAQRSTDRGRQISLRFVRGDDFQNQHRWPQENQGKPDSSPNPRQARAIFTIRPKCARI